MAAALLLCAAEEPDPNPDATVEIEEVRIGFLFLGGSLGGGRLRHHGAEHAFTISGLGTGSLGVSSLQARGEVFGLDRLEDFPGTYAETQVAAVAGQDAPVQVRWLTNAKGVRLRLRSTRAGVMLEVSATGVVIGWQ